MPRTCNNHPVWPEYKIAVVPWTSQAFHLFATPAKFASRAATGVAKRGADVADHPADTQCPISRTPPVTESLYKTQWPASLARSGRVAVVIAESGNDTVLFHFSGTGVATAPRQRFLATAGVNVENMRKEAILLEDNAAQMQKSRALRHSQDSIY